MDEQQRRRRNQLRLFTTLAVVVLVALPLALLALGVNAQVALWVGVVAAALLAAGLGALGARR
jgi:putative flippase GtrA